MEVPVKIRLATYTGFKIVDGVLKVPLGGRQYFDIPLNSYVNYFEGSLQIKQ